MQDRIERTTHIPTDIDTVWHALTTSEGIRSWFGDTAEIDLRPGGEAWFGWSEYGDAFHAIVEAVDPPHRFAYRWTHASSVRADESPTTLVEFTLTEDTSGTTVTVVESGFEALPAEIRVQSFSDNTSGWQAEMADLVRFLTAERTRS